MDGISAYFERVRSNPEESDSGYESSSSDTDSVTKVLETFSRAAPTTNFNDAEGSGRYGDWLQSEGAKRGMGELQKNDPDDYHRFNNAVASGQGGEAMDALMCAVEKNAVNKDDATSIAKDLQMAMQLHGSEMDPNQATAFNKLVGTNVL